VRVGSLVVLKEGHFPLQIPAVGVVTKIFPPIITNPIMWVTVMWGDKKEEIPSQWLSVVSE
jgi:hypothetical protein